MMSGDLPVTSDADALAKQRAKEADIASGGGTMLQSGAGKRKAGEVSTRQRHDTWIGGERRVPSLPVFGV